MVPPTARLYHPKGPDRTAVVSVQPSTSQAGGFLIQLARGTGPGPLMKGTVYGPFPEEELPQHFADVLSNLKTEGFVATGLHDLLHKINDPKPAARARAVLGLGWRGAAEGVDPILNAMPKAIDEICSFIDALGAIGDARAIPVVRAQAARKLLSRRRSAVEALRNLGDLDGLASARQQALERLPDSVRQQLESFVQDKPEEAALQQFAEAVLALKVEQRGLALDTLYELATPLTIAVTRRVLPQTSFDQAHLWRYVKSIYKRAMLRHDYVTWGWLGHAIEMAGRSSTGILAVVKSGYDGSQKQTHLFSRKTQQFMRRLSWRFLRQLASHRPEAYASAAAEALIPYAPTDGQNPQGLYGQYAGCYVLTRILWEGGQRFVLNEKSLRFRFRSAADVQATGESVREEAYPHLWDAQPQAYLRLLGAAQLPEVHAFAIKAIEARHPHVLGAASIAEIVSLLHAPHEPTVKLGLAELERRFDPHNPDWALLDQVLREDRPGARELGERWLRLTAPQWTNNLERILFWLLSSHVATRALAAQLTVASLRTDAALGPALTKHIFALLHNSQVQDANADGIVTVARGALLDDLTAMLSLAELFEWIGRHSLAILPLAGDLLGRRTESMLELGLDRLAWLAQHDIAALRAGAHRLIRRGESFFREDTSLLLTLAESAWEDTRKLAVDLLRRVLRPETLDLDGIMGFLDSSHAEVRTLGQELAGLRLASLPTDELAFRISQHSDATMRPFALELVVQHLPDGADALARLESFFRSLLFDPWPRRVLKERVLDFLAQRGLRDEDQAAVAARLLSDVVRMQGRTDFESALETLVRLQLAFPQVASSLRLSLEGVT